MSSIDRLLAIMARLRDPQQGCPWDLQQTFRTIAPYTIEEAYEVAEAIERENLPELREELGDLLFQVVFHAQMAREQGAFSFDDVVAAICDKMERRHPHVFGTERIEDAAAQTVAWEEHKRKERARNAGSILDDIPIALPALTRAAKLGKRVAQVGFDWPDIRGAANKLHEEVDELEREILDSGPQERIAAEIGDVLFCVVNICRHLKVDPEQALKDSSTRFERRFRHVERRLGEQGKPLDEATLEEMDALWDEGKKQSG